MDSKILNNLAVVEKHFANETAEVEKAVELYTDDIFWASPVRDLVFEGKQAVANNYWRMFGSISDLEIIPIERSQPGIAWSTMRL